MTHIDRHSRPPVVLPNGHWRFAARIVRWTDGDTAVVDCLVDVGFEEMVTKRRRIRLADVDAPETRSADPAEREAGQRAKAYVEAQWPGLDRVEYPGTPVIVDVIGFDKYGGRDLGRIAGLDNRDVAICLLEVGLATAWTGRRGGAS